MLTPGPFITLAVVIAPLAGIAAAGGACRADRLSPVQARLVAEQSALVPGTTGYLGVVIEPEDGWHVYWPGLSEAGMQVTYSIKGPEGYQTGQAQWPAPERYEETGGIINSVYHGPTVLIIPVQVPASAPPGESVAFEATVGYFACRDVCVPGETTASLSVQVGAPSADAKPSADAGLFAAARRRHPVAPPKGTVESAWKGQELTLRVPGAASLLFHPSIGSADPVESPVPWEKSGDTLAVRFQPNPATPAGEGNRVVGVLSVGGSGGKADRFFQIDLPMPGGASPGNTGENNGPGH
ncbi:MAG: hypothetical protein KF745_03685 [Phycisphaeraceae bacterium]|nr:hypothetical protein [Phycisphaeraceae bacterium]